MKLFGIREKDNKQKIYFLGIPIFIRKKVKQLNKYYLFGIKIFEKKSLANVLIDEINDLKHSLNSIKVLLSSLQDIESYPKASGYLRILQMCMLKILKEVVSICNQNDISYFILFGTLLGAVRHKGFIPWDDDLDIVMLRDDFEKFTKLLQNKYKNNDVFSYYYWSNTGYTVLKVILKVPNLSLEDCPFIDIHSFDLLYLNKEQSIKKLEQVVLSASKNIHLKRITNIGEQQQDIKLNLEKLKKATSEKIMKEFSNKDINDLTGIAFMGIEFPMPKLCYLKIDDIFPLVKLKFEDMECYAPKNYKDFLYRHYGDYMNPQIDGEMYHFDKTKFSYDSIKYMQNFISNT